jgi:hypothetical protein
VAANRMKSRGIPATTMTSPVGTLRRSPIMQAY